MNAKSLMHLAALALISTASTELLCRRDKCCCNDSLVAPRGNQGVAGVQGFSAPGDYLNDYSVNSQDVAHSTGPIQPVIVPIQLNESLVSASNVTRDTESGGAGWFVVNTAGNYHVTFVVTGQSGSESSSGTLSPFPVPSLNDGRLIFNISLVKAAAGTALANALPVPGTTVLVETNGCKTSTAAGDGVDLVTAQAVGEYILSFNAGDRICLQLNAYTSTGFTYLGVLANGSAAVPNATLTLELLSQGLQASQ